MAKKGYLPAETLSPNPSPKCHQCHQMQHHKEENTYQKGNIMNECTKWTAEDDAELLDFCEFKQERDFVDLLHDAERMVICEWLDTDAMEEIRSFLRYAADRGNDSVSEQLTEVIEKVERDPLSLTVYDLLSAGNVLHMVPSVTFHDLSEFREDETKD